MKVTLERAALSEGARPCSPRRRAAHDNSDPLQCAARRRATARSMLKATDLDLEITERRAADVAQPGATTLPAHTLYDIVRKLPDGAQVSLEATGDAGQLLLRSGRSRFNLSSLPESDFPDLTAGDFSHQLHAAAGRSQAADRQDAIRDLHRRDALLSQRHLCPCDRGRGPDDAARRRDRRPPAGARRTAGARGRAGMPGVILPRKAVQRSAAPHRGRAGRRPGRNLGQQDALHLRRRRC